MNLDEKIQEARRAVAADPDNIQKGAALVRLLLKSGYLSEQQARDCAFFDDPVCSLLFPNEGDNVKDSWSNIVSESIKSYLYQKDQKFCVGIVLYCLNEVSVLYRKSTVNKLKNHLLDFLKTNDGDFYGCNSLVYNEFHTNIKEMWYMTNVCSVMSHEGSEISAALDFVKETATKMDVDPRKIMIDYIMLGNSS